MAINDIPYPSDRIEQVKRQHKQFMLGLERQIFKDRVDSLKYEMQKLD